MNAQLFLGIVEDIDDPDSKGRYKVRIFPRHTQTSPKTSDLPWSRCIMPVTSDSDNNTGETPYLSVGSWVIITEIQTDQFFIFGSILSDGGLPNQVTKVDQFSKDRDEEQKSVTCVTQTGQAIKQEPEYNKTKTIQSKTGHTISLDDNSGKISIVSNTNASYIEIDNTGSVWVKGSIITIICDSLLINASKYIELVADKINFKSNKITSVGDMSLKSVDNKSTMDLIGGIMTITSSTFTNSVSGMMTLIGKVIKLN